MIGRIVPCKSVSSYVTQLTRCREYEIVDYVEEEGKIKIKCDNGKYRWFPENCFSLNNEPVLSLIKWSFDDNINEIWRDDFLSWVEITLEFNDGSKRWCKLFTPELLHKILNKQNVNPPGMYVPQIILVRSFEFEDVENTLRFIEKENDLIQVSILIV